MDQRIEAVVTEIVNDRIWSIENLASSVNLSSSRLRHLFRQEVGLPLGLFIRKSRLEGALALLDGSFLSVKQVGYEVGFADGTHFCREFRKNYGTTPGLYRRLQASRRGQAAGSKKSRQIAKKVNNFDLRPTSDLNTIATLGYRFSNKPYAPDEGR